MDNPVLEKFAPKGFPADWRQMRIGEAIEAVNSPVEMRNDDEYLLASIRRRFGGMFHRERLYGRQILTKNLQRVIPGTFIMARMQIVHGACTLADEKFKDHVISKSYSSFSGTDHCDIRFFSKLAEQPFMTEYFRHASHGIVIEKMTFQQARWLDFPIWLPPLEEQRRIAEVLDTIDESIQATERVIAKLISVYTGLMSDLLGWNAAMSESQHYATFGELAELNSEQLGAKTPSGYTFKYIDLSSVSNGSIDIASLKQFRFADAPSRARRIVRDGDVLFGTVRPQLRPHARVVGEGYVASTGFCVIRPKPDIAHSGFLGHLVLSDEVSRQAARRESGSNYPAVTEQDVATIRLPRIPQEEQRQTAEILDTVNGTIQHYMEQLAKLAQLRSGMSADLLSGRVRTVAG